MTGGCVTSRGRSGGYNPAVLGLRQRVPGAGWWPWEGRCPESHPPIRPASPLWGGGPRPPSAHSPFPKGRAQSHGGSPCAPAAGSSVGVRTSRTAATGWRPLPAAPRAPARVSLRGQGRLPRLAVARQAAQGVCRAHGVEPGPAPSWLLPRPRPRAAVSFP